MERAVSQAGIELSIPKAVKQIAFCEICAYNLLVTLRFPKERGIDMKEILVLKNNPGMEGICEMLPDVEFACPDGHSLKMQLILPMKPESGEEKRYPLIVFIQGSAWTKPNQYFEIPQLSDYARKGYAIATVTHRSCFESPAPAFLVDVKSAIRFLRAHAQEYRIDPERVCAWGTSSGGNTALLLGVTGGMAEFDIGENLDQSSAVKTVVDCFGPTDLEKMVLSQYVSTEEKPDGLLENLAGGVPVRTDPEKLARLRSVSPVRYVEPGKCFPPFLILHGDSDPVVRYEDSLEMYEKLLECGHDASMVRVTGAPHEGSFWSRELHAEILKFIEATL